MNSTADSQISSISLHVNTGYLNDPPNQRGMAKLLEGMLFLGSHFFPSDVWKNSMTINGEFFKSSTHAQSQIYTFSTQDHNFLKRLEQWVSFFIDPLLPFAHLESKLDQLIQEVDSKMKMQDNAFESILHEISDEKHPFKIQGIENLKEMRKNLNQTYVGLLKHFRNNYCSENMVFVIKTNQSIISQLQSSYLAKLFRSIPTIESVKQKFLDIAPIFNSDNFINFKSSNPFKKSYYVEVFNKNNVNKLYLTSVLPISENDNDMTIDFIGDILNFGFNNTSICSMIEEISQGKQCSLKIQKLRNSQFSFDLFTLEVSFLAKNNFLQEVVQIYLNFLNHIKESKLIQQQFDQMQTMRQQYLQLYESKIMSDADQVEKIAQLLQYKRVDDIESFGIAFNDFNEITFSKFIDILIDPKNIIIVQMSNKLNPPINSNFTQSRFSGLIYSKNEQGTEDYPDLFDPVIQVPILEEKMKKIESVEVQEVESQEKISSKDTCIFRKNEGLAVFTRGGILPLLQIKLQFQKRELLQNVTYQPSYYIFTEILRQEISKKITSLDININIKPIQQFAGFELEIQVPSNESFNIMSDLLKILINIQIELITLKENFIYFQNSTLNTLKIKQYTMSTEEYFEDILGSYLNLNVQTIDSVINRIQKMQFKEFNLLINDFLNNYHLFMHVYGNESSIKVQEIFNMFALKNRFYNFTYEDIYLNYQPRQNHSIISVENQYPAIQNNLIGNFYLIGKIDKQLQEDYIHPFTERIQQEALQYLFNNKGLDCKITTKIINNYNIIGILVLASDCSSHIPTLISQYIDQFIDSLKFQFANINHQEFSNLLQKYRNQQSFKTEKFFQESQKSFQNAVNNYFKQREQTQQVSKGVDQFYSTHFSDYNKISIRILKTSQVKQMNQNITNLLQEIKEQADYQYIKEELNLNECKEIQ